MTDTTIAPAQARTPEQADRTLGFTTMTEEVPLASIDVQGSIPSWVDGRLIRVTPALLDYDTGKTLKSMGHWFDGLGMLNCFDIAGGEVRFASRFLESDAYRSITEKKSIGEAFTMGTDPCHTLGKRMMHMFESRTPNANINIARVGERYMALTEAPVPMEFDPETLETIGGIAFEQDVEGQWGPLGHPHATREGAMVSFFARMGRHSAYRMHLWEPGTTVRREIASIPFSGAPRYQHSFAMTEKYYVLTAQPLAMKLTKALVTGRVTDGFDWDPTGRTDFIVVDRESGEIVGTYEGEPFFFFHHANAFDDGDDIVIDVVAMNDPASVWSLQLDRLRDPDHKPRFYGELRRYRLTPATGRITVTALSEAHVEFPRINHHVNGVDYAYVYCAGYESANSAWFDQIVKIDVRDGSDLRWQEDGSFPGEPVFIRRPGSKIEDDGIVLSVVLDTRTRTSFVLVLDARTMEELARAYAPHHIGFDFHGGFFREQRRSIPSA